VRVARRSSQPRELVRLSPLQFSLSVSIVVILLGGAALAGYYYGLKQASLTTGEADAGPTAGLSEDAESKPEIAATQASVTFYSALTEPREEDPAAPPPRSVQIKKTPVEAVSAVPSMPAPGIRGPVSGSESKMLQVASYRDQVNARKLLQDLLSEGYAGTVVQADLGERGVWFRVRVGPFNTGEEAKRALEKLRKERKLKGYIVKQ
jgi:cell division septation protein DedD